MEKRVTCFIKWNGSRKLYLWIPAATGNVDFGQWSSLIWKLIGGPEQL